MDQSSTLNKEILKKVFSHPRKDISIFLFFLPKNRNLVHFHPAIEIFTKT